MMSFQTYAQPASKEQIQKIIEIEHWNELKTALTQNGLTHLKNSTEQALTQQMQIPQPVSAKEKKLIKQMTDIIIDDLIAQIDQNRVEKNITQAYQHLTDEQAHALIQLYTQPNMIDVGKKFPATIAYTLDGSIQDFMNLVESKQIKSVVKELKK